MDNSTNLNTNGVHERTIIFDCPLSPGRGSTDAQAEPSRNPTTGHKTRREWKRTDNINAMECYYKSDPERRGYIRRMCKIWQERDLFQISEQRLSDQVRLIKRRELLTEMETEEIKRRVNEIKDDESVQENKNTEEISTNVAVTSAPTDADTCSNITKANNVMTEEEENVKCRLLEIKSSLSTEVRQMLPNIRSVQRNKLLKETETVNTVMQYMTTDTIGETNDLIYAGAVLVSERLGIKQQKKKSRLNEPPWKRRLDNKLKALRKDLSQLTTVANRQKQIDAYPQMEKKYRIRTKGLSVVIEELKQRVTSTAAKIKRFTDRIEQYRQNTLFQNDERKFYQYISGKSKNDTQSPESSAAVEFWNNIWGKPQKHNEEAQWWNAMKNDYGEVEQQKDLQISEKQLDEVIKKLAPWKAAGPDGVQGFWIKRFTTLHRVLREQMQDIMMKGQPPEWMTKGRTVLIQKDSRKGNTPSNYRPITCLPIMWKLLTSVISEAIYQHLDSNEMMPWEQKGCGRGSRGTKDQLCIDKGVMKDSKKRKTNLAMAWIDYKKAYDMVPHSWIIETLKFLRVADNIQNFLSKSMSSWKTRLESKGELIGEVQIKRGIFQGDSLSPLLFVMAMIPLTQVLRKSKMGYEFKNKATINHLLYMDDLKLFGKTNNDIQSLINTVRIFSSDIGMQFGLDKCAVIVLKKGKSVNIENISMPNGEEIRSIGEDVCTSYKYLGILEDDQVKHKEMKKQIEGEYFSRVRKVLRSKLNAGNMIKAVNTWAVSLVRYAAGVVDWNQNELQAMDRKTRKLLTIYGGLHPKSDVDRIYLDRKKGGRGLMGVEETVRYEEQSLYKYFEQKIGEVMENVKRQLKAGSELTAKQLQMEQRKNRMDGWKGKAMHGQHPRQTEEFAGSESWQWLKRGSLKRETESLIIAAQDQALRTNHRKAKIEKQEVSSLCRMCQNKDETVTHLVSECSKMAQREYKGRHDKVASAVHWGLAKKYGLSHAEKWYDHRADSVSENQSVKLLWDFNIQTDKVIHARRPDIVLVKKLEKQCLIIDIAVPGDSRTWAKEEEKIDKYEELAWELRRIWNMQTKVIPVVVGALGTVSSRHLNFLAELGVDVSFETIQKTSILGTAHILRKVLSGK